MEFTVAGLNLERFYDDVNDPNGDTVLTAEAYAKRKAKASLAIRNVLLMPDILGVAEVENIAVLGALADKINADAVAGGQPNPEYQPLLMEGNDVGLIDVGFLVKTAPVGGVPRVTAIEVAQIGKDTTYDNADSKNDEPLNDRPSLALKARVADPRGGDGYPLTVIVNHLRSLGGIATEQHVRDKRYLQAVELANEIQRRQAAGERIVLVGDFNAYQFSDGWVDVMGIISGKSTTDPTVKPVAGDPVPADVNPDLVNLLTVAPPDQQYSYVFDGSAQQIDHALVTDSLLPRVAGYTVARFDADFPLSYYADGTRPERLSDYDAPVVYFSFPTSDVSVTVVTADNPVKSGRTATYTVRVANSSTDPAYGLALTNAIPAGTTLGSYVTPAGWACQATGQGLSCTAASMAGSSTATFSIAVNVPCDMPDRTVLEFVADVDSAMYDPDLGNNKMKATVVVDNPPPAITGAGITGRALACEPQDGADSRGLHGGRQLRRGAGLQAVGVEQREDRWPRRRSHRDGLAGGGRPQRAAAGGAVRHRERTDVHRRDHVWRRRGRQFEAVRHGQRAEEPEVVHGTCRRRRQSGAYDSPTSSIIITANPTMTPIVARSTCPPPWDSGMNSSATT